MEQHVVKVRSIEKLTHNVLQIKTDKPSLYTFTPGQATEVGINKAGWEQEKRPFTFTSLPADHYLSFVIKIYEDHNGLTKELLQLKENDDLILHEVFGAISYKGEGIFIAGGAGITPFISIFKCLKAEGRLGQNKLIFANKTKADIILEKEFKNLLGVNFVNILSAEKTTEYAYGYISRDFLSNHVNDSVQKFYLCGPDSMMEAVEKQLVSLGVDQHAIIKEEF